VQQPDMAVLVNPVIPFRSSVWAICRPKSSVAATLIRPICCDRAREFSQKAQEYGCRSAEWDKISLEEQRSDVGNYVLGAQLCTRQWNRMLVMVGPGY
jgi:hypothetical protein